MVTCTVCSLVQAVATGPLSCHTVSVLPYGASASGWPPAVSATAAVLAGTRGRTRHDAARQPIVTARPALSTSPAEPSAQIDTDGVVLVLARSAGEMVQLAPLSADQAARTEVAGPAPAARMAVSRVPLAARPRTVTGPRARAAGSTGPIGRQEPAVAASRPARCGAAAAWA